MGEGGFGEEGEGLDTQRPWELQAETPPWLPSKFLPPIFQILD